MGMENRIFRMEILTMEIMLIINFREKVHLYSILGTYKWRSGAIYVGNFSGGSRHGHGVWRTAV